MLIYWKLFWLKQSDSSLIKVYNQATSEIYMIPKWDSYGWGSHEFCQLVTIVTNVTNPFWLDTSSYIVNDWHVFITSIFSISKSYWLLSYILYNKIWIWIENLKLQRRKVCSFVKFYLFSFSLDFRTELTFLSGLICIVAY